MGSHQRHEVVDLTDDPPSSSTTAFTAVHSSWRTPSSSSRYGTAPSSSHYTGNEFDSSGRAAKRPKYSAFDAVSTTLEQPAPAHSPVTSSSSSHAGYFVWNSNSALKSNATATSAATHVPANSPRAPQIGQPTHSNTSTAFRQGTVPSTPRQSTAWASPVQVNHGPLPASAPMQRPVPASHNASWSGRAAYHDRNDYAPAAESRWGFPPHSNPPRVEADTGATRPQRTHPLTTPKRSPVAPPATHEQPRFANQFSAEEDHYLLFLKEVKAYSWKKITEEFNAEFAKRTYPTLQSRYSNFINRRDRAHDPKVLSLPPRFASEAAVDWQSVHALNPGPRSWVKQKALLQATTSTDSTFPRPAPEPQRLVPQAFPIRPSIDTGYSSGDSAPRREKSSRAARVDYTWPRSRRRLEHGETSDALKDEYATSDDEPEVWATPAEMVRGAPDAVITADITPLVVDFEVADARLACATMNPRSPPYSAKLPYMSVAQIGAAKEHALERAAKSGSLQGCTVHVDFAANELRLVEESISRMMGPVSGSRHTTRRRQLRASLRDFTEPKLLQLTHELGRYLRLRDKPSIRAFLQDAQAGKIAEVPRVQRLAGVGPDNRWSTRQIASSSSMIRERELGGQSRRGWRAASRPLTYQLKNQVMDTFGPAASWTGASGDVHAVAWAPDGESFAAAAVAIDDPMSMQYNRPNNLLFGECSRSTIYELGEHYSQRKRTEHGPNSTHAMFASQDPKIFNTVSSIGFSRSGNLLYSAGYDGHMCAWYTNNIERSRPKLGAKLNVKAPIDMIAINPAHDGILAAAVKVSNEKAIRLLQINEHDVEQFKKHSLYSSKAVSRPDLNILPTAIQFEPRFGEQLLTGFGPDARDSGFDTTGDLGLWDVATATRLYVHGSSVHVFDVEFNPNRSVMPLFAVGCVAGNSVNRGTRSTVRLYDERADTRFSLAAEIECKALDINDVVWCPYDEHLIAAGCTDGRAYVWDVRYAMDPLHVLTHGRSVMPLQDGIKHEQTDTGVRFLSWGENATRLYSGSSDGVVKVWDATRSQADALVKDIFHANTGIMAAAFSPDFSKLVVGEVNGSVNVLEVGREDCTAAGSARLRHVPYDDGPDEQKLDGDQSQHGVTEARHLLHTRQLQVVPMGVLPVHQVVQGPSYAGPYDSRPDAALLREQASAFQRSLVAATATATAAREPPCRIAACQSTFNKTTIEDTGDSGRSLDRIPDQLRRAWTASPAAMVPGKAKCSRCGRAARPGPHVQAHADDGAAPLEILCERCSFACFRCAAPCPVCPGATQLVCPVCAASWDMGVLGFDCTREPRRVSVRGRLPVPPLSLGGGGGGGGDDGDASYGCDVNALGDYYFGLGVVGDGDDG